MKSNIIDIDIVELNQNNKQEIRQIVNNPPHRPQVVISYWPDGDYPKNWDGSPKVTCSADSQGNSQ